jgi:kynurenine formamidase
VGEMSIDSRLNDQDVRLDIRDRQIIDLTHPINTLVPTFEGEHGTYQYEELSSVAIDGCLTGCFKMPEHFGTHIDAPAHFFSNTATIDKLSPSKFILPCYLIDVREPVDLDADYCLTLADILRFENHGLIAEESAVLLLTGWDKHYGNRERYRNANSLGEMHFPGFSAEAAKFLVHERKIAALGIDTLSVDAGSNTDYSVHKIALKENVYLIENLTNLAQVPARGAVLFCAPLPIEGGSGSPARVLAMLS